MNVKFEDINIDEWGTNSVYKPDGCIDYQSDEINFDFLGKNKKILLRIGSKFKGHAHNVGKEVFDNN